MANKIKSLLGGGGFYAVLALCVVAVGVGGYFLLPPLFQIFCQVSVRKASIGCKEAAFMAGYTPNTTPLTMENPAANSAISILGSKEMPNSAAPK